MKKQAFSLYYISVLILITVAHFPFFILEGAITSLVLQTFYCMAVRKKFSWNHPKFSTSFYFQEKPDVFLTLVLILIDAVLHNKHWNKKRVKEMMPEPTTVLLIYYPSTFFSTADKLTQIEIFSCVPRPLF